MQIFFNDTLLETGKDSGRVNEAYKTSGRQVNSLMNFHGTRLCNPSNINFNSAGVNGLKANEGPAGRERGFGGFRMHVSFCELEHEPGTTVGALPGRTCIVIQCPENWKVRAKKRDPFSSWKYASNGL